MANEDMTQADTASRPAYPCPECPAVFFGTDGWLERSIHAQRVHEDCLHALDEGADEPDRCVKCDRLVCPDCGRVVDYDPASGDYTHPKGAGCWLHPTADDALSFDEAEAAGVDGTLRDLVQPVKVPTVVVVDLRLARRGYVVSHNAAVVLVQWYDRPGVQTIPVPSFTTDRYEVQVQA